MLVLAAVALAATTFDGISGLTDLVVYWGPLLLVVGLLLGGRFIGAERILARLRSLRRARVRPPRRRWSHLRDRALTSQLARATCLLRGPPAAAIA
jgi:hypothetical protein